METNASTSGTFTETNDATWTFSVEAAQFHAPEPRWLPSGGRRSWRRGIWAPLAIAFLTLGRVGV